MKRRNRAIRGGKHDAIGKIQDRAPCGAAMADRESAPCDGIVGDPAVTALIDSRGKLTNAQAGEKLRAEIERERSRPKPEDNQQRNIANGFDIYGGDA
jgi:hypothetical protein